MYVKRPNGRYREATQEEILDAATEIINARYTKGTQLTSTNVTRKFLRLRLGRHEYEVFSIVWLDNHHRVITFEEMFRGTINGGSVYPREVLKSALRHNAAACILAHNHPSGEATPSAADRNITRRLIEALRLVDVRVLDHFIVGAEMYSFAEHGDLP